jgi:hypothetical protein
MLATGASRASEPTRYRGTSGLRSVSGTPRGSAVEGPVMTLLEKFSAKWPSLSAADKQ